MRINPPFLLSLVIGVILVKDIAAKDYKTSVIMNPSISRRCQLADKERQEKLRHKQKIMELISRNQMLVKKTPPHKKSVLKKLKINFGRLRQELRLTLIKISRQEEDIVRKGCPGINF